MESLQTDRLILESLSTDCDHGRRRDRGQADIGVIVDRQADIGVTVNRQADIGVTVDRQTDTGVTVDRQADIGVTACGQTG